MLVQVGRRYVSEQREIDPLFARGMKDLLATTPVFHDTHKEFLRDLIVSANRKEFPPNRFLMEEGTQGDCMYVIYKGLVEVTQGGRYVCKLKDGSIVGEAAMLSMDSTRTASVRSIVKCDVAIINRSSFHTILERYPWEKKKFQRQVKARLIESGKLIDTNDDLNLQAQAAFSEALKKVPFFAQDESLDEFMGELAMHATDRWFRPGHIVLQEGDGARREMFVLLRGAVEVSSCGQFLGRMENELFGEIGVMDLLERRSCTVVAATHCHCLSFTREVVIPILAKYPEARLRILEYAKNRLLTLNKAITDSDGSGPGAEVDKTGHVHRLPGAAVGFGRVLDPADANLFATNPMFTNVRLDLVKEISQRMTTRRIEEGRVIFKEGDDYREDKDFVYWIAKGEVEIWKTGYIVQVQKEGEVFGDLTAFDQGPREATARTKTRVILRQIKGVDLHKVLATWPDEDVMKLWRADMEKRRRLLLQKVQSFKDSRTQVIDIDSMFFKLPVKPEEGPLRSMLEPLGLPDWEVGGVLKDTQRLPSTSDPLSLTALLAT